MKMREAFFIGGFAALVAVHAAEPAVEFSGVLTNEGHTKLALTDKSSGTTRWLEPGDIFLGYTVDRYDVQNDAVFLRKNGQEVRLTLIASKITEGTAPKAAAAPAPGTGSALAASPETVAANAIRGNLRTLAAAARRYQLEHGGNTATYADLVGPDKMIRELRPIAGESYANLSIPPGGTTLTVTMTNGVPVSVEIPAMTTPATVASLAQPAPATAAPPPAASTTIVNITPPPPATTPAPEIPIPPGNTSTPPTENLPPTGRADNATPPASYTAGVDETWESVAQKTGVPVQKLKELNSPIPTGSSLPQGQTIRLR